MLSKRGSTRQPLWLPKGVMGLSPGGDVRGKLAFLQPFNIGEGGEGMALPFWISVGYLKKS